MEENKITKFNLLMTTAGEIYNKTFSKLLLKLYWDSLQKYTYDEVENAIYQHIKSPEVGRYPPKPADIVAVINRGDKNQSLQAWKKVEHAIKHVGSYASVVFDDALIHAVIFDMGGWISLCAMTYRDLPLRAKEFQTRYQEYLQKPPHHWLSHLIGIFEAHNSCNDDQSLQLIGDRDKALQVHANGKPSNNR